MRSRPAVVAALRDAAESTAVNVDEAREAHAAISARAYLVLRQHNLTHREIRRRMNWSWLQLWRARYANPNSVLDVVQEVWAAADSTCAWRRTSTLLLSGEVMQASGIEPRLFASHHSLDTSGAEYVNVLSGNKWLLFSQMRWNGFPASSPEEPWHYEVWHVGDDHAPTRVDVHTTLGVQPDTALFGPEHGSDGDAFAALDDALRSLLGVLPDTEIWPPARGDRARRWLRRRRHRTPPSGHEVGVVWRTALRRHPSG